MSRSLSLGYFALMMAQVTISVNVVASKYLLASSMPMFMLLTCRFGLSTLMLAFVLKFSGSKLMEPSHPEGKLTRMDWILAILQGIFAAFLFNLFFVAGLQNTTATAAGIVGSTLPAIIALSAVWFLKEQLGFNKIFALLLAIFGILVINFDHFDGGIGDINHSYFGDFLIFLAMFPEAWYSIISRKLRGRVTPLGGAFVANLVGFIALLLCALMTSSFNWSVIGMFEASLLLVAGLSSLIFFWAWAWGLSFISASTAAIFGGVMPVSTTLLAVFLLEEELHWYDCCGMLLVFASIIIGSGGWRLLRKSKINTAI